MHIRDRIRELRRVPARELKPHPKNWRTHPPAQQDALRGVLAEIGYAGALLARELEDGALELIDGHLRAETTPDVIVPVLVLDLTADEADKLLATFDPISSLARADAAAVERLLAEVRFSNPAVQAMVQQVAACTLGATGSASVLGENGVDSIVSSSTGKASGTQIRPEIKVPTLFQIVVECGDETDQRELYERLSAEGFKCRVLTL